VATVKATLGSALLAALSALPVLSAPAASAEPCPDVDVSFARGTNEDRPPHDCRLLAKPVSDRIKSQVKDLT